MTSVNVEQTHLAKLAAEQPGKRFRRLYRLLCQPEWLNAALDAIRPNKGFNTPGTDGIRGKDLDEEHVLNLAERLRNGTYQPTPVRRVFIPKQNGKLRPLGLPSAEDKVVQSALKLLLEPLYEGDFRDCSHGFRPERSCHTALKAHLLSRTPTWTLEGDLESFFDRIDHGILLTLLRKKIADEQVIELIRKFLKAGYLHDWQWHATYSGTPQGGVLSPLLANVVLHAFDQYLEDELEANRPTETGHAAKNPAYNRINLRVNRLSHRIARETDAEQRATMLATLRQLQEQRKRTPSRKPVRRLTYQRYADDWVIGLHGYSKAEAWTLKAQIAGWLTTHLKLSLSPEKTLITHWSDRVKFLGFESRGIKSWANGASQAPRLLISHDAETRVKHSVAKLTRQTSIEPADMLLATNQILRGWMNYYCYATNPHRVFARVLHHAFWCLTRYLNKRTKQRGAKKVMRRYYGAVNGKKTLVVISPLTNKRVSLIRSIGRKSLYALTVTSGAVDRWQRPWMVYSAAVGRSPWQRAEIRAVQQGACAQCGAPLTEVHHQRGLSAKTNPTQAGYAGQKVGLCHACHALRTQQQRGWSRQGKLDALKGARPV
jgi:group II intron reverse transcriptase/maturase